MGIFVMICDQDLEVCRIVFLSIKIIIDKINLQNEWHSLPWDIIDSNVADNYIHNTWCGGFSALDQKRLPLEGPTRASKARTCI